MTDTQEGEADYKWGEDYGKDLLTDLNQLAHAKGTGPLHRDAFQRAHSEIATLSRQLAEAMAENKRLREAIAESCAYGRNEFLGGCGAELTAMAKLTEAQGVIERQAAALRALIGAADYFEQYRDNNNVLLTAIENARTALYIPPLPQEAAQAAAMKRD